MKRAYNCFHWMLVILLIVSLAAGCEPAHPTAGPQELPTTLPTAVPAIISTPAVRPMATPAAPSPSPARPTAVSIAVPLPTAAPIPPALASEGLIFATFKQPGVATSLALAHEAIAPGLGNVHIPFVLSQSQLERLARDGFVVSPGVEKEFFTVYEKARYANVPIFVTSDSLLHVYHLLFDKTLRTAETQHFIPLLRDLNEALLASADGQYRALQGSAWEDAARRTVAFVGVASRLLDSGARVPDYVADLVEAELTLVESAPGIVPSPIFPGLPYGEDYTQYVPRGHYTKSDALKAYFKSMMWYGRMTFRLKTDDPEVGRAETRSALLLVQALRTAQVRGQPAVKAWADLYSPTVFFVGRSDDLTVLQCAGVMDAVYGKNATASDLVDEVLLDTFIAEANKLPPPKILGIVIDDTDDVEVATKGLRFMGQRFVPDAYIFRELVYRNVGTREHRRGLPKGLDLAAAMGSARAYQILEGMGETSYRNYPEQMAKMQVWLAGLGASEWTETLYNTWLYSFYPLLEVPGETYPAFTRSPAWLDKQLNTVLGSWAELKHDTLLYAKQVYAEMGGGPPPPEPVPPKNYVEPVPLFYARLAALTVMTREGLESRGLLSESDAGSLLKLEGLARALQTMAEKELRGEALTDEEQERIRFYGGELEHLTIAAADTEGLDPSARPYMDEEPQAAVIADVATDPDPSGRGVPQPIVLEVGVGRINEIHVVVPVVKQDGTIYLQVAKGGVFAYYEFPWPAEDRLTDEKWREMLDKGTAPSVPEWTRSFLVEEGEYGEFQLAVFNFQKSLISALWYVDPVHLLGGSEVQAQFGEQVEALRAAKQCQGRLLISTHFRSFDRQSVSLAVVTVRETWEDKLYQYTGEWPDYSGEPVVAQRGPYSLDVTYTLERVEGPQGPAWQVSRMVYGNEPPGWSQ